MNQIKSKKIKHNYTNELELKSLLIRIKNKRKSETFDDKSSKILKYINLHQLLTDTKYTNQEKTRKKKFVKQRIKDKIINLSEQSDIDDTAYERFGEIILLMIKNILTKPQFSGYTYKDEFYSDSVHKILRYLDNFDHKMISPRTGLPGNAFAYISQIIHHSILYIINTKKKEMKRIRKQCQIERLNHNYQINIFDIWAEDDSAYEPEIPDVIETIHLKKIKGTLTDELIKLSDVIERVNQLNIYYPRDYFISFEEYDSLKPLLKSKINIMKMRKSK